MPFIPIVVRIVQNHDSIAFSDPDLASPEDAAAAYRYLDAELLPVEIGAA